MQKNVENISDTLCHVLRWLNIKRLYFARTIVKLTKINYNEIKMSVSYKSEQTTSKKERSRLYFIFFKI